MKPVLWWVRRDLRLSDNPALTAAAQEGRPIVPVFICDASVEELGAAPKWRLGAGLKVLQATLEEKGSRLILKRGKALEELQSIARDIGAGAVHWNRLYDPVAQDRDTAVKATLKADGITATSHGGHLLFEPWTVETKTGGYFKVYSPMWRAVQGRDVPTPQAPPTQLPAPQVWPASDSLEDWALGKAMNRGAEIVEQHGFVGETAALDRLTTFANGAIAEYKADRDFPAIEATSRLSASLSLGEIGPRSCWHAGQAAMAEGRAGAEHFLKELVWREFAYHLMYHTPQILTDNWRSEWSAFPWQTDANAPEVLAWKQGRTGIPFVDAAMREMYVTGTMHNRGRMIVASYLTKHLMTHWKVGLDWFADCLVDWDPASNALGWQWTAGPGPDAAPYFRVFNPVSQLEKFDPHRRYADRWIAEGRLDPSETALSYFDAVPRSWGLSPSDLYPEPIVSPSDGRARALAAYEAREF